jgi:hypothetical protein
VVHYRAVDMAWGSKICRREMDVAGGSWMWRRVVRACT